MIILDSDIFTDLTYGHANVKGRKGDASIIQSTIDLGEMISLILHPG
jgi:hypothetical protein